MKNTLYKKVVESIRKDIRSGRYRAGEKLPSEKQLAERYKVSLITIRRVSRELQQENLIYSVHGKGSFLSEKKPAATGGNIVFLIDTLTGFYSLKVIAALEKVISANGYTLALKEGRFSPADHAAVIRGLSADDTAGIIIQTWMNDYSEPAQALRASGIPSVFISYPVYGAFDYITSGDEAAAFDILTRMSHAGIGQAAFVVQTTATSPLARAILKEGGIRFARADIVDVAHLLPGDGSLAERESAAAYSYRAEPHELSRTLVNAYLAANDVPECFFCINDYAAAGTYRALIGKGLRVPEDVSIVSLSEGGEYFSLLTGHAVSGMVKRTEDLGSMAAELMLMKLRSGAAGIKMEVAHCWQTGDTLNEAYRQSFQDNGAERELSEDRMTGGITQHK